MPLLDELFIQSARFLTREAIQLILILHLCVGEYLFISSTLVLSASVPNVSFYLDSE